MKRRGEEKIIRRKERGMKTRKEKRAKREYMKQGMRK